MGERSEMLILDCVGGSFYLSLYQVQLFCSKRQGKGFFIFTFPDPFYSLPTIPLPILRFCIIPVNSYNYPVTPCFLHVFHVPLGVSCVPWKSFLIPQTESPDHIHMELVICACGGRVSYCTYFSLSGQIIYERIYQKKKNLFHILGSNTLYMSLWD